MARLQGFLDGDIAGARGTAILREHDAVDESILRGVSQRAGIIDEVDMLEGAGLVPDAVHETIQASDVPWRPQETRDDQGAHLLEFSSRILLQAILKPRDHGGRSGREGVARREPWGRPFPGITPFR